MTSKDLPLPHPDADEQSTSGNARKPASLDLRERLLERVGEIVEETDRPPPATHRGTITCALLRYRQGSSVS